MRLDILKDNLTDCTVTFTRDGEDETANILNPNGGGNIIVTYFNGYPEPYCVHFHTRQRHFSDAEAMFYYVVGIITENIAVVELLRDGKCRVSSELAANALLNMTVEELAECFGYTPEYLAGKVCRIRSWAGSYNADLEIVEQ